MVILVNTVNMQGFIHAPPLDNYEYILHLIILHGNKDRNLFSLLLRMSNKNCHRLERISLDVVHEEESGVGFIL